MMGGRHPMNQKTIGAFAFERNGCLWGEAAHEKRKLFPEVTVGEGLVKQSAHD